jgi:hypothetical protein
MSQTLEATIDTDGRIILHENIELEKTAGFSYDFGRRPKDRNFRDGVAQRKIVSRRLEHTGGG